ncbi:MAG: hypothetical protein BWY25_02451 [Chloroflexi bacterium ADurb.Bin222]|nr:MAG: hypothetical protein BWY25_02451 [Chloroflexi bacterium ADurb.Bin222]
MRGQNNIPGCAERLSQGVITAGVPTRRIEDDIEADVARLSRGEAVHQVCPAGAGPAADVFALQVTEELEGCLIYRDNDDALGRGLCAAQLEARIHRPGFEARAPCRVSELQDAQADERQHGSEYSQRAPVRQKYCQKPLNCFHIPLFLFLEFLATRHPASPKTETREISGGAGTAHDVAEPSS